MCLHVPECEHLVQSEGRRAAVRRCLHTARRKCVWASGCQAMSQGSVRGPGQSWRGVMSRLLFVEGGGGHMACWGQQQRRRPLAQGPFATQVPCLPSPQSPMKCPSTRACPPSPTTSTSGGSSRSTSPRTAPTPSTTSLCLRSSWWTSKVPGGRPSAPAQRVGGACAGGAAAEGGEQGEEGSPPGGGVLMPLPLSRQWLTQSDPSLPQPPASQPF